MLTIQTVSSLTVWLTHLVSWCINKGDVQCEFKSTTCSRDKPIYK